MTLSGAVRFCLLKLRGSLLLQILFIIAIWFLGDWFSRALHLPIPGGVTGMFILIALFATGKFSTRNLRRGAEWFLAEMLLFFIPAVPAILNHREFLGWLGIKILIVILAGTVIVMVVTAFVVEICFRWIRKHTPQNPEESQS